MIYGIEMNREGWDLFCSRECCSTVHEGEHPVMFFNRDQLERDSGITSDAGHCFRCGKRLRLHGDQTILAEITEQPGEPA